MATCGYICPKCEGIGFLAETLEMCDWCKPTSDKLVTISVEEWIKVVHESNCCSDIGMVSATIPNGNIITINSIYN